MKIRIVTLFCLLSFLCGYAYSHEPDKAQGLYRVIWSDGTKNDTVFGIVQTLAGKWMLTDEKGFFKFRLDEAWKSDIIDTLGDPIADASFCLRNYGASVNFFCLTRPGISSRFVSHDFISPSYDFITKTNYLMYMELSGIFNLEKVAGAVPVPPMDDAEQLKRAESGSAEAQYQVGAYYFEHIRAGDSESETAKLAAGWLEKSVAQDDRKGLAMLAYIYENVGGPLQNLEQAHKYYLRAADKGNTFAMKRLGDKFLGGLGLPTDEKLGAQWYIRAAEADDGGAQAMLIRLYSTGRGVPQNGAKALEWAGKSLRGQSRARAMSMYYLGEMYAKGNGVPRHPEKAIYWMREAARRDSTRAMTALGEYYKNGLGDIPPDPILAVAWLRQARGMGVDQAVLQDLKTLEGGLTPMQLRAAEEAYQQIGIDLRENAPEPELQ